MSHKIISYTPEMLLKDNLNRGVKEELLRKQNDHIEANDGEVKNEIVDDGLSEEEKFLLLNIKKYYDKIGTIYGVAKALSIQDWRVRKYLRKGHWYGLFYYDKFSKKTRLLSYKKNLSKKLKKIKKYEITKDRLKAEIQIQEVKKRGDNNQNGFLIQDTLLSKRAKNSLINAGYQALEDCANLTEEDILLLRNIGNKTAKEILDELKSFKNGERILGNNTLELEGEDFESLQDYLIQVLSYPLSAIMLSVRATHILMNSKNVCLFDLVQKEPDQLLHIRDCGFKTVKEIGAFLETLGLQFRMRFSDELIKKVLEYQRMKSSREVVENFKKDYPKKYNLIINAKLRNTPQERIDQCIECFRLYKEEGTLANAGKKLKLTRERVRQILKQGTSLGLFNYSGHEYPYFEKEKLLKDYARLKSLHELAKINNVGVSYLRKILTAYKVKDKDLDLIKENARKNECIEQYQKIVTELGHHPTTTELQNSTHRNMLARRILKIWGTTDKFREELNVPKVIRTFPEKSRQWMENRRRLAFIVRMENLDRIRDTLLLSGSMRSSEIVYACSMKPPKVLRLLNLLLARKEVIREGIGSTIKYRINEEAV